MVEDRLFLYRRHRTCTKKNTRSLREKCARKKIEKNEKKIFYEKIRHVPGRRSVQKTEDEKSKPVQCTVKYVDVVIRRTVKYYSVYGTVPYRYRITSMKFFLRIV